MKNSLVEYQGGGYSGCIWEYNFAFINGNGEFMNIYSSGSGGANNMAQLQIAMLDEATTVYDLTTEEGLQQVRESVHIDFQRQIAAWIYENTEFELLLQCGICENLDDHDEMHLEQARGDGGIGIVHDLIICNDCRSEGSCQKCGDYTGEKLLVYNEHREQDLCEWCHESVSRHCFDCGEVENSKAKLNKQRMCGDCQTEPSAPKKGERWQGRKYQGKQVFVLC